MPSSRPEAGTRRKTWYDWHKDRLCPLSTRYRGHQIRSTPETSGNLTVDALDVLQLRFRRRWMGYPIWPLLPAFNYRASGRVRNHGLLSQANVKSAGTGQQLKEEGS